MADLTLYETKNAIPQQSFSTILINGGINDQTVDGNHGEANLDVQNIIGVSHPLPVTSYITGGSPPFIPNLDEPTAADNENEPYLNYYQYLLAQNNSALPQVITNSYGDDEQTVPLAYATRVCNMIGQLGARGISVLESSGDTGVGAPCQSNDGKKTPQFTPQFPGTCPYITAVGGTQAVSPEVAWVAGSGGFSNYFAQPSYQASAVNTYLTKYLPAATKKYFTPYTNFTSRGFPDVSAHSLTPDYAVYVNNAASRSGGTSAASPVFAAIIALVNDARLRAGKPALGFLNPFLYGAGLKGLTDITGGGSVGCNGVNGQTGATIPGASIIPYASWNATVGWDPVTGLGTPNFMALMKAALA
ncbi:vesicle formation at the endoplasmic reticulum [Xylographa soralifera]|nr:vesicle formation at the endoplasmic reticulum [Xylographa soralifera]